MSSNKNEMFFSFGNPDQCKQHLASATKILFEHHWSRTLKGVGFYTIPLSQEAMDEMRSQHFSRKIIEEILDTGYSISRLTEEMQVAGDLIYKLRWNSIAREKISLSFIEKLLVLHTALYPALQPEVLTQEKPTC
jgi:hypothetical protein